MATLLQHSTFPQNEPWYLRAMASKSREEVGHTKEGQQHANRLESIAKMLEAAVEIERERDELRLRFSDSVPTWIPVGERSPDSQYDVLVTDGEIVGIGDCCKGHLWNSPGIDGPVTHWMPLPEAP